MRSRMRGWICDERPNILLTSVGRRAYLVRWFKEALDGSGEVHAVNSSLMSTGLEAADISSVSPIIHSSDYIPFLLEYCVDNRIGALIPLFDIDIPVIAENRKAFEEIGCFPLVPTYQTAITCNDKFAAYRFLKEHGIGTVETFLGVGECMAALKEGRAAYPVIAKPRWGMGSIGIMEANDEAELRACASMIRRRIDGSYLCYESSWTHDDPVIFQAKLQGTEYGLDVVNDLRGHLSAYAVKRKLAMRAGETDCAQVIPDDGRFGRLAAVIAEHAGHAGNMDVDVFDVDGELRVLEMNARFGGGYPFSHACGLDIPRALISWLRGDDPDPRWLSLSCYGVFQKDMDIVQVLQRESE